MQWWFLLLFWLVFFVQSLLKQTQRDGASGGGARAVTAVLCPRGARGDAGRMVSASVPNALPPLRCKSNVHGVHLCSWLCFCFCGAQKHIQNFLKEPH